MSKLLNKLPTPKKSSEGDGDYDSRFDSYNDEDIIKDKKEAFVKSFKVNKDIKLPGTDYILEKGDIITIKSLREAFDRSWVETEWKQFADAMKKNPKTTSVDKKVNQSFLEWLIQKYPDNVDDVNEAIIEASGPGKDYEHGFINPRTHEEVLYAY